MELDKEAAYFFGLWMADRCSTAKGVVGIRNTNPILLEETRRFLGSLNMKIKEREVRGYSLTREVYCCNSQLRRFLEELSSTKEVLLSQPDLLFAYFGGLIDGDGTIDAKRSTLRIYYGKTELANARTDSELLARHGFKTTIKRSQKVVTLNLLRPRKIACRLLPFVRSSHKRRELEILAV